MFEELKEVGCCIPSVTGRFRQISMDVSNTAWKKRLPVFDMMFLFGLLGLVIYSARFYSAVGGHNRRNPRAEVEQVIRRGESLLETIPTLHRF